MLKADRPLRMDDLIIPGRDMAVMFRFGRIEIGETKPSSPRKWPATSAVGNQPVYVIGQRDMPDQPAIGGAEQRDVIGDQPFWRFGATMQANGAAAMIAAIPVSTS